MTHYLYDLRDGRHLGITGLGDPDATRLVVFCHPAPGAGGFDPDPTVTSTAGVRVIAQDRPGYGGTELVDGDTPAIDRWLSDLDEYLRSVESNANAVSSVEFGRIGLIGWGMGAVYASVFAGRYPQVVEHLALVEPTAPTEERLAPSDGPLDARIENFSTIEGLTDYPGAADRLGFMLDDVHDDAGLHRDREVLADDSWHSALGEIAATTIILSSGETADALWYQSHVHGAVMSSGWPDPSSTIFEAWPQLLAFLQPRESKAGVEYSDRRASSLFPQVPRRPH